MHPDDFPANNEANRRKVTDDKRVERVTSTDAIRKKKPLRKQFTETLIGGDLKSTMRYVVFDIALMAAREMILDVISGGSEKLILGDSRRRGGAPLTPPSMGALGRINYAAMGGSPASRLPSSLRAMSRAARSQHDFDQIVLESRTEAEQVIEQLFEVVSRYGTASVADLYELVGLASTHTDHNWGWSDVRGAGVTRDRNGYLLDLPSPQPIPR